MQWVVTAHLMPPKVSRSASYDAIVEQVARVVDGEWSAEPLEAALADVRGLQLKNEASCGWTTYHPPGYRITFRVSAPNVAEARDIAASMAVPPDGWRVDSEIELRPAPDDRLPG
jgi:hypothetical protein